jgi:hypothetical protein
MEELVTRFWKSGLIALLMAVCGACQSNRPPAPPEQQELASPAEVTLRVGEATSVDNVDIRFSSVLEDSRCPSDVQCIWAGNGRVSLAVGPRRGTQGPTEQVLLNTYEGDKTRESWGLRVTLVDLTPAPKSVQSIPLERYVARMKVEAAVRD